MEMVRRQMDIQVWGLEKSLIWRYAFGNDHKDTAFIVCIEITEEISVH